MVGVVNIRKQQEQAARFDGIALVINFKRSRPAGMYTIWYSLIRRPTETVWKLAGCLSRCGG